jgi:hypothetical protein
MMGRARITTVIATSPIPTIPDISHIRRTVESLQFVPELAESPILIVFDAPADNAAYPDYEQYKRNLTTYFEDRANVKMLHLEEWGCLTGVMERAVQVVDTPFLFVQQHDLPLVRSFECGQILECLKNDPAVKHVRLNKQYNRPIDWDRNSLFGAYKTPYTDLTRTGCWSDNSHLTTSAYYREVVIPEIRGKRTFPEAVLNRLLKATVQISRPLRGRVISRAAHRRLGTFIYGAPGDPPVITHTDGRMDGAQGAPSDAHRPQRFLRWWS